MNAKELIKEGKLSEARTLLVDEIKKSPGNTGLRTLLFQVLIFSGEWEKADRHLDAVGTQNAETMPAIALYKSLVQAERERLKVIKLKDTPSFATETPEYFPLYWEAMEKLQNSKPDEALKLFQQIDAQLDELSGTVNGKEFKGFTNTDSAFTYFLETFAHERYILVPFEKIRELLIQPPESLFDLIWPQATLTTWGGLSMNCFLPALYPETYLQENNELRMGKLTDWAPRCGPFVKGIGQQVFEIGGADMAILEIQELLFNFTGKEDDDEENN